MESVPGPSNGLLLDRSLARPDIKSAEVLENAIPTRRGARIRGGLQKAGFTPDPIVSLFSFVHPTLPALFAATAGAIYDATALDPDTEATVAVSGLTSGYFATQQIGTAGGVFLYAVNGTDNARLFDGTSWLAVTGVSTPAITGATTSEF